MQAAPLVAGTALMLMNAFPAATAAQVKTCIEKTAAGNPVPGLTVTTNGVAITHTIGGGRLDVDAAFDCMVQAEALRACAPGKDPLLVQADSTKEGKCDYAVVATGEGEATAGAWTHSFTVTKGFLDPVVKANGATNGFLVPAGGQRRVPGDTSACLCGWQSHLVCGVRANRNRQAARADGAGPHVPLPAPMINVPLVSACSQGLAVAACRRCTQKSPTSLGFPTRPGSSHVHARNCSCMAFAAGPHSRLQSPIIRTTVCFGFHNSVCASPPRALQFAGAIPTPSIDRPKGLTTGAS